MMKLNKHMPFLLRQLESRKTLGEEVHAMRRRLAISLEMAAMATKIQKKYLRAIEEQNWSALPEPVYTRNFLRTYVQYLGGDVSYFLSRFQEERACCDFLGKCKLPRQKVRHRVFVVPSRILKFGMLGLLLVGLFTYLGIQVSGILRPPTIVLLSPADGMFIHEPEIVVEGTVEGEASIFINDQTVLSDAKGYFSMSVALERGVNIITVSARKRYSRPAQLERTVVFRQALSEIPSTPRP